jgi:hypothetical protein
MFVTMSGLPNRLNVDPLSSRMLFTLVLNAHCLPLLLRLSDLMIRFIHSLLVLLLLGLCHGDWLALLSSSFYLDSFSNSALACVIAFFTAHSSFDCLSFSGHLFA